MTTIAIGGFIAECNPRAPEINQSSIADCVVLDGASLLEDLATAAPTAPKELHGFWSYMQAHSIELVGMRCVDVGACGPIPQSYIDTLIDDLCEQVRQTGPAAVYLALHGSAKGSDDEDPEGTLLMKLRHQLGPHIPMVATLDLHANVSRAMVEHTDLLLPYRTNPHIDMVARGGQAADYLMRILGGLRLQRAFVKLALIAPSPTHLTDENPIRSVINLADSFCDDDPVSSVSITTGYTHGDSPKSGMAVIAYSDASVYRCRATDIAIEVAQRLWRARDEFILDLIDLPAAVQIALAAGSDTGRPAVAFADTCDNPGGGGRGNTIWLLSALYKADVCNGLVGCLYDARLAEEAHRLGVGSSFTARFNVDETHPLSGRFECEATVEALHNGTFIGRRGSAANQQIDAGRMCLLRANGLRIAVISIRQQTLDPMFFEVLGVDLNQVQVLAIKSRGHFRAGFDEFFSRDHIYDVDTPGITARRLEAFEFKNIRHPIYPLDAEASWDDTEIWSDDDSSPANSC